MVRQAKQSGGADTMSGTPLADMLDRYFGLSAQGTNVHKEYIAGVITFLTMV